MTSVPLKSVIASSVIIPSATLTSVTETLVTVTRVSLMNVTVKCDEEECHCDKCSYGQCHNDGCHYDVFHSDESRGPEHFLNDCLFYIIRSYPVTRILKFQNTCLSQGLILTSNINCFNDDKTISRILVRSILSEKT